MATAKRRLLSSGELADALGLARRTVSKYAKEGLIVPELITPTGRYFFDEDDVRRQLRAMREQTD